MMMYCTKIKLPEAVKDIWNEPVYSCPGEVEEIVLTSKKGIPKYIRGTFHFKSGNYGDWVVHFAWGLGSILLGLSTGTEVKTMTNLVKTIEGASSFDEFVDTLLWFTYPSNYKLYTGGEE